MHARGAILSREPGSLTENIKSLFALHGVKAGFYVSRFYWVKKNSHGGCGQFLSFSRLREKTGFDPVIENSPANPTGCGIISTKRKLNNTPCVVVFRGKNPMNKRCRKCGAPAPDNTSVFCNKCGTPLPAEEPDFPVCGRCGKAQIDRQSRFCDRCGAPIPVMRPEVPITPALQRQYCRKCGAENTGAILLFCRKCGTPFAKTESRGSDGGGMPPGRPAQKRADTVTVPPGPAARAREVVPNLPERRQEAPPRGAGSYRKIAIGIAAVVLIAIAAFILLGNPGLPGTSENASEPGLPGALPLPSILEPTGAADTVNPAPVTRAAGVSNRGTPVFSDSPLNPQEI